MVHIDFTLEIGKEPATKYENQWPNQYDPEFKKTMVGFFNECHNVHLSVMEALAIGLKLHPGYFNAFCDNRDHNLRLLHYPSVPKTVLDKKDQTRAGAHTDYGTLTLLFQDDVGGLQVRSTHGDFVAAPPIRNAIIVNAGDLLARWSNDRIKSTEHRVISPPSYLASKDYPARSVFG